MGEREWMLYLWLDTEGNVHYEGHIWKMNISDLNCDP